MMGLEVIQMAGQKPIAKFRAGQISCALWENDITVNGNSKIVLKASVSRRYKDKNGDWKSSQSFGRSEVFLAIHCLRQAVEKMIEEEQGQSSDNRNGRGIEEEVEM